VPAGQIAFNATGAAQQAAASGWPNLTLGLRAANEGDSNSWKRFQKDASLQIDYNSISTVGAMSTTPATACVSGGSAPAANDPLVNNPRPVLTAYANDADTAENDLTGTFAWQSWNGSAWVAGGSGTDPIGRAANTQTSFTLPAGALSDGVTYRWQVQINDPLMSPYSGTDHSAWSQWCEFIAEFGCVHVRVLVVRRCRGAWDVHLVRQFGRRDQLRLRVHRPAHRHAHSQCAWR
jgi:hypothetical protein